LQPPIYTAAGTVICPVPCEQQKKVTDAGTSNGESPALCTTPCCVSPWGIHSEGTKSESATTLRRLTKSSFTKKCAVKCAVKMVCSRMSSRGRHPPFPFRLLRVHLCHTQHNALILQTVILLMAPHYHTTTTAMMMSGVPLHHHLGVPYQQNHHHPISYMWQTWHPDANV